MTRDQSTLVVTLLASLTIGVAHSPATEAGSIRGTGRTVVAEKLHAFCATHANQIDATAEELLSALDAGDVATVMDAMSGLEMSGVGPVEIDGLLDELERYSGETLRVEGTWHEFDRQWRERRSQSVSLQDEAPDGPSLVLTSLPPGPGECPFGTRILGTATGRAGVGEAADYILVLDSSSSLTTNDPSDFRLAGANALADALSSDDRLAIIDFDAPEICCSNSPTCDCSISFNCPEPHANHGTEVESCFIDPVAHAQDLDDVLTDTHIARDFGGTSFQGAAFELLNLFENCPAPVDDWGCVNDCPGSGGFGTGPFSDNDRTGHLMPLGGAPRVGVPTRVIWFTDGENSWGCDVTAPLRDAIKNMDPDGVTVDVVKLGVATGSPELQLLVEETGGLTVTVTDPADLVDALVSTLGGIEIASVEAFNDTDGGAQINVGAVPAPPALFTEFSIFMARNQLVFGSNSIRVVATDTEGASVSEVVMVEYLDTISPDLVGCPSEPVVTSACEIPPPPIVISFDQCDGRLDVVPSELIIAGTCADAFTIERSWTATDAAGNASTCTQLVEVFDDVAPEINVALEPVAALPPAAPGSVCSAASVRQFQVVCEASDDCGREPEVAVTLLMSSNEVTAPDQCSAQTEEVAVECGDVVRLELQAPACPKKAKSADQSTSVNSDGIVVVRAERIVLRGVATDACGNEAVAEYDPSAHPSPLCDEVLADGTCCAPIAQPLGKCKEAVCEPPGTGRDLWERDRGRFMRQR